MYGTVNELCARLLQRYKSDELMTLIIWTKEDVLAVLDDESVTEETAGEIVCDIATWDRDAQHEAGVGAETLRVLADNIRYAAAQRSRPVTLSAGDLEILVQAAGRLPDAGAGRETDAIQAALRRAYLAINK